MPLPFDSLPHGLQCAIFEKFNYAQFGKFEGCSESSADFCDLRRYVRFPYKVHHVVFRDGALKLVRGLSEQKFKISGFGRAIIQAKNLNIWDRITREHITFVIKNVRGLVNISLLAPKVFPDEFFELLKTIRPKVLNIDVSVAQNDIPTNFKDIDIVNIKNGPSLTLKVAFSVKAKRLVIIEDLFITAQQVYDYLNLLLNKKAFLRHNIYLERIQKFEIDDLIVLLKKEGANKEKRPLRFEIKSLNLIIKYRHSKSTSFDYLSFEKMNQK